MKPRYSTLFLLLSSALLTACGGGGGGGGGANDAAPAQAIAPAAPASQPLAVVPAAPDVPPVAPDVAPPAAAVDEPEAQYRGLVREIGHRDTLSISGFNTLNPNREFTVKVEGTDIAIDVAPLIKRHEKDSRVINGQKVLTLRDADGKLAGYYGHVHTYTHRETAQNEDDQDQTTTSLVYAVNVNEGRRPETQADYVGTLFYNHFDIPREAAIRLHYQDNKITGNIKGSGLASDIDYVIREDGDNTVSEEGTFGARLHRVGAQRNAVNGHLVGGFYGKEGEVAAGEVKFIDNYSVERGGVFGAQRVQHD
ncbi:hypothetical protein MQ089_09900 [Edwardsiella anguillarum]|uniref:hypothetical protein n=1 Tax=Edwardsiella anguillarum TaxID=1821960 RepID=UPI0024B76E3F|nr:hypothetical protein [Edwardsiella anguillarum]WHP78834.1 hypothetical protein MQ090_09880 [Edwardsiella anguillarum]WHQ16239.1 hypothetical protein MQ085_09910 [Edwardsiella anguillarum]WHQ19772.1 hypothetical protein MQ089_09900 [Edwardsiella anguillarum]WHQ23295.1 hypothetical protein MQ094_09915 [Edwardsiella anguillarum]WHQ26868.1 hypothetical protein MQ093_10130 [Edwardsiella anguillarum]